MAHTPDYATWLAAVESDDHEELYALYKSAALCRDTGYFRCAELPAGGWLISAPYLTDQLCLQSDEIRLAFMALLAERNFAGMEADDWVSLMRAMTQEGGC